MDLIQLYRVNRFSPPNYDQNMGLSNMQKIFLDCQIEINSLQAKTAFSKINILNGVLQKVQKNLLIGKMQLLPHFNLIDIKTNLFIHKIFKWDNFHEKKNIIRLFLKTNVFSYICLKFNSISGQFTINSQLSQFITLLLTHNYTFKQVFINFIEKVKIQTKLSLEKFSQYIFNQSPHSKKINQIKNYVITSQYYAWDIVTNLTEVSKKQLKKTKYPYLKQYFLNNILISLLPKTSNFTELLPTLSTQPIHKIQDYINLSTQQDQKLKDLYLIAPIKRKQFKLLNQITLSSQQSDKLMQKKDKYGNFKINTQQFGLLPVYKPFITKDQAEYEYQILKKLPPDQFIGLPKYYYCFINNKIQFVFTNLTKCKNYSSFLENNKSILTINTQFFIFNQISLALRYLKNHKIVYHNLHPQKIIIKKGLVIKLVDYTNSYHKDVPKPNYSLYQNRFPFVVIFKIGKFKSFNDQRSDVFSLGSLMYYVLNSKQLYDIKDSNKIGWNEGHQQIVFADGLKKGLRSGQTSFNKLYNLIELICLKTMEIKISKNNQQNVITAQNNKRIGSIEERPYLDWMVILSKQILNYLQFTY